jgi:Zn finger protein HypA/HybF involved in hydrogenase expression
MHTVNTSEVVEREGVYRCEDCGNAEQVLRKGELAPFCDNCKDHPVTWEFRRPLTRRTM